MKVNGVKLGKFTVFYRCRGVEMIVEALKSMENAIVDETIVDEIADRIAENIDKGSFDFDVRVRLKFKDSTIDFDEKVRVFVKCKIVENPDYLAISTAPNVVRVVADVRNDYDFIRKLSESIADHLKVALNFKNAVEFFDLDVVSEAFKYRIDQMREELSMVDIIEDFVKFVLKDLERRTVIARDCRALEYLRRFERIVFVVDCPSAFDKILERVMLSNLSGRELKKRGLSREDVIKPNEIEVYVAKVIA
ncbi:hypothetical protein [Archaeoglobus profundus]|uniref:Uncharacterized protein n=1 Tax=Archaeoglobus profundus (strain DSM 5631 / JCM 9629 / NBRC 100127 / Av18) TaxID=572546 RepID=D2RF66_ARCPA|nr:hypothetical protein [Archaeoglobus profundus]ADB58760.1 hypothetical protein Arcpr_1715 [Archaeoglobus profundus DSM 5631]